MLRYTIKRLFLILLTLFLILTLSFFLIKLLPNYRPMDPNMSKEHWEAIQAKWGYNLPVWRQYFIWLKNIITGWEWGDSTVYAQGRDIFDIITEFIPTTMRINIFSLIIFIPVGFLLGIIAALKKNKPIDYLISVLIIVFISVPSFVIVTLLILSAYDMGLPIQYPPKDQLKYILYLIPANVLSWKSLVIPVLALSFGPIAGLARYTRAELTEVLTSEYLLLARTKGLNRFQSTIRHALRNSMVPLVPAIVTSFIGILFGSLVIEQIYSIPGVGGILIQSIGVKDYNLTMGALAFYTVIDLFAILLVDLSYGIVDPRIRMGAR